MPGSSKGVRIMIPRQNTRELVDSVQSLLLQYAEYWPITIRQIFYRLVCTTGYPNTERAYRHLREKLHRVRVAGMLPHNAVRDDDVAIVEPRTFNTQLELVYSVADN